VVFRTLYRSAILDAYRDCASYWPDQCIEEKVSLVELELVSLFDRFSRDGEPSVQLRKSQLASQSGRLCRIRSNKLCLYCLFQSAQHVLGCGHTLCDRCAQVFGIPSFGLEYQFTIRGCAYCLYKRPLVANVLPSTMGPSILAIDGGGVRGVIPLEFLLLVQEHLRPCRIQDVVDLSIGTSSGNKLNHYFHFLGVIQAHRWSRGTYRTRTIYYVLGCLDLLPNLRRFSTTYFPRKTPLTISPSKSCLRKRLGFRGNGPMDPVAIA
jgi:hypothetical protein